MTRSLASAESPQPAASAPGWGRPLLPSPERAALIARFLAVGLLNTAVGYGLYAAFYLAFGTYELAIVLATALGIVFNFFSTGRVVFANRTIRTFVPFVLGYAVTCGLNIAGLRVLVGFGVGPLLGQILLLPAVVVLSFLINDRLVFRRPS